MAVSDVHNCTVKVRLRPTYSHTPRPRETKTKPRKISSQSVLALQGRNCIYLLLFYKTLLKRAYKRLYSLIKLFSNNFD